MYVTISPKAPLFVPVCRKEIREAGMTLIFDARKKSPQPQFYKALMALHVRSTQSIFQENAAGLTTVCMVA